MIARNQQPDGHDRCPAADPIRVVVTVEPPSHVLRPRTEDLGASWSAHACRCRHELPAELAWAAPLLDAADPLAVLCSHEQARDLIVWHHHLPTYRQVSFGCEHLAHDGPATAS